MSEVHGFASKSEIWAGVLYKIPVCCSATEYIDSDLLEDITATGDNFGSSSPCYLIHSAELTDLKLEVILTNRSLLTYLCRLE